MLFSGNPALFNGIPLSKLRQKRPLIQASDLNCGGEGVNSNCLWAAYNLQLPAPTNTQWSIGYNIRHWSEIVRIPSHPIGQFIYQFIDPMADISKLPQLRSVVVPCTQTATTLSFKFVIEFIFIF